MSSSSGIKIHLGKIESLSEIILILQQAGWGFYNKTIVYEIYDDPQEIGNERQASEERLPMILQRLQTSADRGATVNVTLYWHENGPLITLEYRPTISTSGYPASMLIHLDASRPKVISCARFTDFTWLIEHIVCPLFNSHMSIVTIECSDDY